MGKRIDLNARNNNINIRPNINARPFFDDENENLEDNKTNNLEKNDLNNEEEMSEESQNLDATSEGEISSAANSDGGNQPPRQSIRGAFRNFGSGALLRNMLSSNNTKEAKENAKETGKVFLKNAAKKIVVKKLVIILIPFLIIFFILTLFVGIFTVFEESNSSNIAGTGGYYELECPEMTVIKKDGTVETYSNRDYVAGVVRAEVGGFNNLEVYKAFAVAARTYGETHNEECTIAGDATRQAFVDITEDESANAQLIYQAVDETDGVVMLNGDSISFESQYDAFCFIEKNEENYILSQKEQEIPTSWVESHINNFGYKNCQCELKDESMTQCWNDNHEWIDGGHGIGMSQYGALYLATEMDYKYDEILSYYYDDIKLSTNGFVLSIVGLEIKDTKDAVVLNESLTDFLGEHGSSVEQLNALIKSNVKDEDKAGTREGVVIAAVTLINFLHDGFGVKLPYYWGGKYPHIGVNPNFGGYTTPSEHGEVYGGFDCSGFVSWAIINGGYNLGSGLSTSGFDSKFSEYSCDMINDSSCVGQPGDLINSYGHGSNHVQLIVHTDLENQKYYIAESSGSLFIQQVPIHGSRLYSPYLIQMDAFYNNAANKRTDY